MNILIAGAGAMGGWLGARLAASGQDVTLLGRQPLADAVAKDGLRVTGHTEFHDRLPVITEPGGGPYDVVFLTTKAHATGHMAPIVAPLVAPLGALVSMQNGLGNAEILMQHLPRDQVVVGITSHGVTVESPGRLRHAGTGAVKVGPAPGQEWDLPAERVLAALDGAGLAPEQLDDSVGHLWLKAAVNAGINPLCAIHGVPNGGLGEHQGRGAALVEEVVALSRAAGVRLPADAVTAFEATVEATAQNKCSMLQDVEAGRLTEIEQITGYFVRLARRLGYPLGENEAVYREVKALEASYLGEDAALASTRAAAEAFQWP